ncbi:GNAT family N-acetyltransferase [Acidipropionibacterium virtanenii]|uniref:N-acetyltransferase domain-containing protein n=1 Tax=Acidipropionibacterium virtanenii TaxID=2057246 RepID=A0A344UUR2_9ACTN|nr:GNAT family N-acetyltransferase [Acidipropionibacterium virtanenii]AXE39010.1 hypothetical protein JS278_01852 [Acidipropionibacterium virtanenii]
MHASEKLTGIQELTREALHDALDLARSRGWTIHEPEWKALLHQGACFALYVDDELVSTITTIRQGDVCVLGMLLVKDTYQRRGIGTSMMRHAMARLPVRSFALAATSMGAPVYRRIGFIPRGRIIQLHADHFDGPSADINLPSVRPGCSHDLAAMASLDTTAYGWPRGEAMAIAMQISRRMVVDTSQDGQILGFGGIRDHGAGSLVGPLTARSPSAASRVLAALCQGAQEPITLQIWANHHELLAWARAHGFQETASLTYMVHGPVPVGTGGYQFAPLSGALC